MCCFFDSKTRKHEFLNATTDRNYFETIFKKHKIDLVVMEACGLTESSDKRCEASRSLQASYSYPRRKFIANKRRVEPCMDI